MPYIRTLYAVVSQMFASLAAARAHPQRRPAATKSLLGGRVRSVSFSLLAKRRSVPTFLAHVRNHWFAARRMSCQINTTRCANANQPMLRDSLKAQTTPRCGAVQLRRVSQCRVEPPQDSEIWEKNKLRFTERARSRQRPMDG